MISAPYLEVAVLVLGTTGAAMLMFAHGLSIALLFGITGEIRKRVASLDFDAIGGLAKAMPLGAFAFGLGVFAAIGLPGFANFAAEIMVVFGAFRNGFDYQHFHIFQWATLLALWGVVISAVYMLRAYRRTFFGSSAESGLVITDISPGFRVPIALLVVASLLLGFFPQIAVNRLMPTFRNYFNEALELKPTSGMRQDAIACFVPKERLFPNCRLISRSAAGGRRSLAGRPLETAVPWPATQ